MEERITVHEKARGETINVYIGEYRGTKYLHIREWYMDKDQEEKPTKKGIALPLEKIDALREAIDRLVPQTDDEEDEPPVKETKPAKEAKSK
ncbi:MAG TPA: transcriptional coactivator p15/PC4 family protein [Trichormus sp.]